MRLGRVVIRNERMRGRIWGRRALRHKNEKAMVYICAGNPGIRRGQGSKRWAGRSGEANRILDWKARRLFVFRFGYPLQPLHQGNESFARLDGIWGLVA